MSEVGVIVACVSEELSGSEVPEAAAGASPSQAVTPPPGGMRMFVQVLVNTAVANVTTSFLWFALTFWVYLETRSVLATGIIGGAYMLLVAVFAMVVRHDRRPAPQAPRDGVRRRGHARRVHRRRAGCTCCSPSPRCSTSAGRGSGCSAGVILFGAVIENMRNIALSTTVTLLVPDERHANANGLVGTVQGLAFIVTSVFSGLAIGLLGMGWTLVIAIALTLRRARAPAVPPHPRGAAGRRGRAAARSSTCAAASPRSRPRPGSSP